MNASENPDPVFREGWALGLPSWAFHRQFAFRLGRSAEWGEYGAIVAQIRAGAERLGRDVYRVRSADGRMILVRGGKMYLRGVMPDDWQPEAIAPPVVAVAPAASVVISTKRNTVKPVDRPAPRASTLTLGRNSVAARVLAERLRRSGIPPSAAGLDARVETGR